MYTPIDARRASYSGELDWHARVKRYGLYLFGLLFIILLVSRSSISSSSDKPATNDKNAQDDDDDDDLAPSSMGLPTKWKDDEDDEDLYVAEMKQEQKEDEDEDDDDYESQRGGGVPILKPQMTEEEEDDYNAAGKKTMTTTKKKQEPKEDDAYDEEEDEEQAPVQATPKPTNPKTKSPTIAMTKKPTAKPTKETAVVKLEAEAEETDEDEEPKQKQASKSVITTPQKAAITECDQIKPEQIGQQAKRVHFIEIPRAGGSTMSTLLQEWAKKHQPRLRVFRGVEPDDKCARGALDASVLVGHGFGYCPDIEKRKMGLFTFTVLRGPVPRITALYDAAPEKFKEDKEKLMVSTAGKALFGDLVRAYNSTLEIEPGEKMLRYFGSQQARFLCGYDCTGTTAKINDEDEIMERAKANLQKLDALGLMEDMNSLAMQLRVFLPDLVPKTFSKFAKEKESFKHSSLDEDVKEILTQWAWMDKALLIEAKALFEKKNAFATKCTEQQAAALAATSTTIATKAAPVAVVSEKEDSEEEGDEDNE